MVELLVEGGDFKAFNKFIKRFDDRLDDLRKPMRELGREVLLSIVTRFEKSRDVRGHHLKRLTPQTIANRARLGLGATARPLLASGRYRGSIRVTTRGRGENLEVRVAPVRSQQGKASSHQFGRGHNPKREVIGVTKKDIREGRRIFRRFLKRVALIEARKVGL